ncbi:hypothetical protein CspHIS471_0602000 [Cutaneotrichosporon sp. HIS471]|nr:hypothetical protein CspHIS471_0602000 [Cutaneotrichosporon sp. HIS471]
MVTATAAAFVNVSFLPLYSMVNEPGAAGSRMGPIIAQVPWNIVIIGYTVAFLVVRGKWVHGRTFTSLFADYIFLGVLSAYGLATNIAKAVLNHTDFFDTPYDRTSTMRAAWNVGAASFILNWVVVALLIATLAFEVLWTQSAKRADINAPLQRPFAYEAPVTPQSFTIDDQEKDDEAVLVSHVDARLEASTSGLHSRASPTSPTSPITHPAQPSPGPTSTPSEASPTAQHMGHQEDLPGYSEGNSTAAAYYAAAAAYIAAAEMAAGGRGNTLSASSPSVMRRTSNHSLTVRDRDSDGPIDVSSIGHNHKRRRPSTSSNFAVTDLPSAPEVERDPTQAMRRVSSPLETLKRDTLALLRSQANEARTLAVPPESYPRLSTAPFSATSLPGQFHHSQSSLPPPRITTPDPTHFPPPLSPDVATEAAAAVRARGEPGDSDELRAWKRAVLDALEREDGDVPHWKRDMLDALERADTPHTETRAREDVREEKQP